MGSKLKLLLGIASCWPFLYVIVFFSYVFISSNVITEPGNVFIPASIQMMSAIIGLLTLVDIIFITAFYIFDLFKRIRLDSGNKTTWLAILLVGNLFVLPIYWFYFIWKNPHEDTEEEVKPVS